MPVKPNIRLPDDAGPNPYDSKTTPNDLPKNEWLVSWKWWATGLAVSTFSLLSLWWRTRGG